MNSQRRSSSHTEHRVVTPLRRSVLAGAAWSVPALAIASAAPAFASSIEDCEEKVEVKKEILAPAQNNLTQGFERAEDKIELPDDVTEIEFDIAGGGGGVNRNHTNNTVSHPGGDGDRIQGTLRVPPGTTLRVIAGNGGIGPTQVGSATPSGTSIKGGGGYGNGGDLPTGTGTYRYAGGSGGGGSAILIGDQPILIAGGGGGSGGGTPGGNWTWSLDAGGGHGGLTATNGTQARGYRTDRPGTIYSVNGGQGASGATPGTRTNAGGSSVWSGTGANGNGRTYGNNGLPPEQGGHGGTGRQSYSTYNFIYTAGAGGGGYAGGASADAYAVAYYIGTSSDFAAAIGGGGGGGSSFVSKDLPEGFEFLSVSHERAGNGAHPALQRNPGWVRISYSIC